MLSIVLEPSLVHWTKLVWIDVLLYKNKTSQVTSIIYAFFAFELHQISHMEKNILMLITQGGLALRRIQTW